MGRCSSGFVHEYTVCDIIFFGLLCEIASNMTDHIMGSTHSMVIQRLGNRGCQMVDLTSQEMLKFAIPALGISIAAPFMTCPGDVSQVGIQWNPRIASMGLDMDGLTQFQDMPMRVIPCVGSRQTCTEI